MRERTDQERWCVLKRAEYHSFHASTLRRSNATILCLHFELQSLANIKGRCFHSNTALRTSSWSELLGLPLWASLLLFTVSNAHHLSNSAVANSLLGEKEEERESLERTRERGRETKGGREGGWKGERERELWHGILFEEPNPTGSRPSDLVGLD